MKNVTVTDLNKLWNQVKEKLSDIKNGLIESFRHDIYHGNKKYYYKLPLSEEGHIIGYEDKQYLKTDLSWKQSSGDITDEIYEKFYESVTKEFAKETIKYQLDVLLPAAVKFFIVLFCDVNCNGATYYLENYVNIDGDEEKNESEEEVEISCIDKERLKQEVAELQENEKKEELLKKIVSKAKSTYSKSESTYCKSESTCSKSDMKNKNLATYDEVKDDDWYQSRRQRYSRSTLMKVLMIGKKMILGEDKISSSCWKLASNTFPQIFIDLPWQEIKEILRNMNKKYSTEKDHGRFYSFYGEARGLWKVTIEE